MTPLRQPDRLGLSEFPCPSTIYLRNLMPIRDGSSGRVQPIEGRYLIEPGTCAMCSRPPKSIDEIFANTQIELDQYGFIYFCQNCCLELADFVMAVPYEKVQDLIEANKRGSDLIVKLYSQVTYLRGLLDARIDLAGTGESVSDVSVSLPLSETEFDSDSIDRIVNELQSESLEPSSLD